MLLTATSAFILFLGRFHPTLVHLPIGFLLMAVLLELFSRHERFAALRVALPFALGCAAVSGVIAAALGYCLSLEGGYASDLLARHQWAGIALALSMVTLFLMHARPELVPLRLRARVYQSNLLLACALLVFAGHQGGALTHGADYLTYYLTHDSQGATAQRAHAGLVFDDFILPVLQERCGGCHNSEKRKGDLVLDNASGLQRGGKHGAIVLAGNATGSELLRRLTLPVEDEAHMPPAGKAQLRPEEIELLRRWIQAGAAVDLQTARFDLPSGLAKPATPAPLAAVPAADTSALGKLRRAGVIVAPIAQSQNFLQASVANVAANFSDPQLELFAPVAEQLTWLDLHNSKVTDAGLAQLSACKNLTRLRLENTAITDAGLPHLRGLSQLEYLNLYGTKVSDAGLPHLSSLQNLRALHLWQTQASAAGVANLQTQLPHLRASLGMNLAPSDTATLRLAPPSINFTNSLLTKPERVTLESSLREVEIHYTLDGSTPTSASPRYAQPLVLATSTTLKAITTKSGWQESAPAVVDFVKLNRRLSNIQLKVPPSARYAGRGPATLIDAQKASNNFDDGMWLGFEQDDVEAIVDLGTNTAVHRVSVSCLENMNSWIFFPTAVEFAVSSDGVHYQSVGRVQRELPQHETELAARIFSSAVAEVSARFVKVLAKNIGLCPKWHKGAGGKAWLFVDEIIVE